MQEKKRGARERERERERESEGARQRQRDKERERESEGARQRQRDGERRGRIHEQEREGVNVKIAREKRGEGEIDKKEYNRFNRQNIA